MKTRKLLDSIKFSMESNRFNIFRLIRSFHVCTPMHRENGWKWSEIIHHGIWYIGQVLKHGYED